jgi:3-oxoacyl-[acyl-carrier protein] reductase
MADQHVLVFGATGAIGSAIAERFVKLGARVTAVSRKGAPDGAPFISIEWVEWDPCTHGVKCPENLVNQRFDAVVWAQGANSTDNIYTFDLEQHEALYRANVLYILQSLKLLLHSGVLNPGARLCVISSIWQSIARQNKLSYCITKSALEGLVNSLAIDLGKEGYLINAVLPGALDTPMTRSNLSDEQIARLEGMTPLGSFATLSDVSGLVCYLCSTDNKGITGQFVAADKGFSYARII